jgi:DNA modification methylase
VSVRIIIGDAREQLKLLPDQSVHCCVTSPPYFGLRDYGHAGQIGLEATPDAFVAELVAVFREVRRVLRDDGMLWLNLGDTYQNAKGQAVGVDPKQPARRHGLRPQDITIPGLKPKDLIGVPWSVAFAMRADGWYLRDAVVWAKPNGMPGSQEDRCTSSYEMIFQFSKSRIYWSDFDAIKTPPRESSLIRTAQDLQSQAGSHRANGGAKTNGTMKAVGANADKQRGHGRKHAGFNDRWDAMERTEQQAKPATMRNVWFIAPAQFVEAHYAVMPDEIARRCILAGCPPGGTVLDPFLGAGTTGLVADRLGRNCIGIELNPENTAMAHRRIDGDAPLFARAAE